MFSAALLAVVLAADFSVGAGATIVDWRDRPAAHIYSTDYYVTVAQPSVRTAALTDVLAARPGEQVRVCVRSAHNHPGVLSVSSARFVGNTVDIPHGRRLRTRCVPVTIIDRPLARAGQVQVEEGTYVTTDTTWPVHGWVRNISVRLAR